MICRGTGWRKNLRPIEVKLWIGKARGVRSANAYDAGIKDVDEYVERWTQWWDFIQPAWRKRDGAGWKIHEAYDENWDWGTLAMKGPNGALNLIASLYFWGAAVRNDPTRRPRFEAAVQDVLWMLEGMAESLSAQLGGHRGRRRGGSGGSGGSTHRGGGGTQAGDEGKGKKAATKRKAR
ncbi:hypothetical protein DFH06DRAFT_1008824 [Mycena polygramma]|nr:hypothetical protein DFH06DRAFT_1008824 [Mycena polygramma]